ncbi:hypothetical protein [Brevibacillus laterosporus]|uniref:hypothetical protein n=1 Tax=Brevibacillus laterosporus TaxID=1465 RepID=UPI003D1A336A|nr:hypothetical protein [Brevibacillus laterosporus]
MKKLSAAMQNVLDRHINAKFADYTPQDSTFYMKDKVEYSSNGFGKYSDGTIKLVNNTATLQALADRGYIEILEIGGASGADTVRLLKHENTNQSVLETHNMVQVDIYLVNSCNGQEYATSGGHFIEDGNIDYALVHWDHCPARANISRVVNKETGEEIYRS